MRRTVREHDHIVFRYEGTDGVSAPVIGPGNFHGIPFYDVPERLKRLDEACQVIKMLFSEEKSNFQGKYYQLTDASLEPTPVRAEVASPVP